MLPQLSRIPTAIRWLGETWSIKKSKWKKGRHCRANALHLQVSSKQAFQEVADSDPTVIEQADVPISGAGLDFDQPVTPEHVQNRLSSRRCHLQPQFRPSLRLEALRSRQQKGKAWSIYSTLRNRICACPISEASRATVLRYAIIIITTSKKGNHCHWLAVCKLLTHGQIPWRVSILLPLNFSRSCNI